MLTQKQRQLLVFIDSRLQETGVSPSYDEMKEALSLKSKSGIHRLITALEERGFIRRLPHRARALEILRLPDGRAPKSRPLVDSGFSPSVVEGRFGNPKPNRRVGAIAQNRAGDSMDLPILGKIAAGTPIEAIQHEIDRFAAPCMLLGNGEHYILEIEGESMVDAGIRDGDYAIIQRCDTAQTGDVVVALVDREEATLKRLRKKGNSIALEAANPAFETRIYGPDRVSVQGKLVGLMRKY